jgi:hypothetical protein
VWWVVIFRAVSLTHLQPLVQSQILLCNDVLLAGSVNVGGSDVGRRKSRAWSGAAHAAAVDGAAQGRGLTDFHQPVMQVRQARS